MLTHMPAVISYPIDLNGQGHCQGHLVSLDSIAKLTEHKSRKLKCSLDAAKRRFYRAANSIFNKIGRITSEKVILQIISSKCMPVMMYGLETLPLQNKKVSYR